MGGISKVIIIIPAYNESESIKFVVDNLISNYPQFDYLIVNDGSKDQTEKICRENEYNFISLPINLGIGGAVQAGYKYALRNGYDIAVQMDGDGQHDPKFLKEMIKYLEEDSADLVIGSRFLKKEGFQSSKMRRFGISFLSSLARILTGIRVEDITSGYRAVNSKLLCLYANDYPSDYPEPEALIIASINGCRIKEYPVIMQERLGGCSSISFWKSIYYMIKVTLAMMIRRLSLGFRR